MYIAIDGGGTKTEYLLLDKHFQVVDHYLGRCFVGFKSFHRCFAGA